LPFDLRWQGKDLAISQPGAVTGVYFAVFVDRAPLAPGVRLSHLVDEACRRTRGCVGVAYFAERHVYLTGATSLRLGAEMVTHNPARYVHRIDIVLMSGDQRLGESVLSTTFRVRSTDASI
jgi:hypothetical protein